MAVYYLDTSALAKLYHQEPGSKLVEQLAREPGRRPLISRLAVVEIHSVLAIKVRRRVLSPAEAAALRGRFLSDIDSGVLEVVALKPAHCARAEQLIVAYGFRQSTRTLDALRLSVAADLPAGSLDYFVSSDRSLCDLARGENLRVITP